MKTEKLKSQNSIFARGRNTLIVWMSGCLIRSWRSDFIFIDRFSTSLNTLDTGKGLWSRDFSECLNTTNCIWSVCLLSMCAWLHSKQMPEIAFLQDFQFKSHKNALSHGMALCNKMVSSGKLQSWKQMFFPLDWFKSSKNRWVVI